MKRFKALALCGLLVMGLAGCGGTARQETASSGNEARLQIVATVFPAYDFARAVCGDAADVTLLLPPGAESHSYEPTPQDILSVQNCDLFLYVGGESDAWVETLLEAAAPRGEQLRMVDCVETLPEETVEGMETHEEPSGEGEVTEIDEHVWTSPKNAAEITARIGETMEGLDAAHADLYAANTADYVSQLEALDQEFADFFAGVKNKTLVFGDRFPLRYFVEEYGLTYYAAFPGCSAQTEPSAATIAFLTDKVKEEHISTVYYIEFSNHLVADSIAEATGAQTAEFDSCHNVSQEQMDAGATYVSIMRENLETLRETMQ